MNKAKDALLLALKGLIIAPFESVFISAGIIIPFIGTVLCLAAVIVTARFIERQRREYYLDMNVALFTVCVYLPGLIASIVFFVLASYDYGLLGGWGGIAGVFYGFLALTSQFSLSIAGLVYALKSRKNVYFPQLPAHAYRPDSPTAPDPDSFFENKGE